MKNHIKISLILSTILLVFSCENNSTTKSNTKAPKTKEVVKEIPHAEETKIVLNNGKKWIANAETTNGILKMQQIMTSYSDSKKASDYKALKNLLETEFTTIFKKCTMKGEAHNQLHNFLKPMLPIFEGLTSSDVKIGTHNFNLLENHLKGYFIYFK